MSKSFTQSPLSRIKFLSQVRKKIKIRNQIFGRARYIAYLLHLRRYKTLTKFSLFNMMKILPSGVSKELYEKWNFFNSHERLLVFDIIGTYAGES